MTPVLTKIDLSPIPLEWVTDTANTLAVMHDSTANMVPTPLGGLWKGVMISAQDIQAARKDLWSKLESAE